MAKRYTIEELSRRTGVSTRNIRAHQTRGLLPPPRVVDRVGRYDDHHVDRLRLIQELQSEGLNLQAIAWLLGGPDSSRDQEVRSLKRALLEPWSEDDPVVVDQDEVDQQLGDPPPEVLDRAQRLGLLEHREDGRWLVPMPAVLRVAREAITLGVRAERLLDVYERLDALAYEASRTLADLIESEVLDQQPDAERTGEEWLELGRAIQRLIPLASDAVMANFRRALRETIADVLGARLGGQPLALRRARPGGTEE